MDPSRSQPLSSHPTSAHPSPPPPPSNDDIEAVIQMATSASQTPDGRSVPIKDTRTQLFVGNLPYRVRWQDLKDLFRRAGTVLRADVSLGPDNRSRGYGTVLLATAEDAGRAIDMFHGYSWQTRILEVRPDRLPPDFDNPLSAPTPNTLPPPNSFSTASLSSPLPSATHLTSPSQTARALSEDFDFNLLFGSELTNASSSTCRNLFVGNLPFHCQWQDLKDLFRQAGTITRADVALGPDGRSSGFGTVVFAVDQDAERAVKMFNGYEYNGRALKVHFDRYSHLSQPSTSPTHATFHQAMSAGNVGQPSFTTKMSTRPNHINLPIGYYPDIIPSGPSSPYDLYHPHFSMFSHLQSQQQVQLPSRSQPLPHELSSSQQLQDSELRSSNDTDSVTTTLALTSISTKPGLISPPQSHQTVSLGTNRSSSANTSEGSLNESDAQPEQSQSHSQNQKFNASSTIPPQNQHPHHPGPISLPPPTLPFLAPHTLSPLRYPGIPVPISPLQHPNMGSPLRHPSTYASHPQMTPHGLPPITPSMPPFIFHPIPPPASPTAAAAAAAAVHTPVAHMAVFGPPSFSPTVAMSPGTFWGRPGHQTPNPFINPAVGAPVHIHSPGASSVIAASDDGGGGGGAIGASVNVNMNLHMNIGGSAYFYGPPAPGMVEPTGYFDPVYFPSGSSHSTGVLGPSGLANEILREKEPQDEWESGIQIKVGEDTPSTDASPTNDEDADDLTGHNVSQDSNSCTGTFSEATSWYNSEESGDEQTTKVRDFGNVGNSLRSSGKNTGSRSAGATTTANGSDAESRSGVAGSGFLGGERRVISRTHSMSSGTKPLFLGSLQSGSDSDSPTSGWPTPLGVESSHPGQK